jgi:tRNA(adenine34) deaminase
MTPTESELEALREAISRAREAAGSGPLAGISAAVVGPEGAVAFGTNEVHANCDATRHAEIVALSRAGAAQGAADLSGHSLISTLQPCEMCLAAMRFSGIKRLLFAARKENVAGKYFMFPSLTLEDYRAASGEGFVYLGGVMEEEVLDLYRDGEE